MFTGLLGVHERCAGCIGKLYAEGWHTCGVAGAFFSAAYAAHVQCSATIPCIPATVTCTRERCPGLFSVY